MRVLFVTNMWPDEQRPWYGSFVSSQARSLQEAGIAVDTLAIRGYAGRRHYLDAMGRMLTASVRPDGPDLVHAHYGHSAAVARLDLRRPLVISYCGDDLLGTPDDEAPQRMTPASLRLARSFAGLAHLAAATITKSEEMERRLPARCRARNHVIPNGVDLGMFRPIEQSQARRQLGWPAEERVALFAGDPAVGRKNYALAERACALAAERDPRFRLRVARGLGPGEVPLWMSAADVLVHPSWSEGSPNVVKEAMACALPVVAAPVGDVPERLAGIPGCHVVARDPGLFADALLDAVEHHPSHAAREAVSELSVERVARQVIDVYEDVLRSRRRRRDRRGH